MKNVLKIGMIGGDLRQFALAKKLYDAGFEVAMWGCKCDDLHKIAPGDAFDGVKATSWEGCVRGSAAVILPLPVTHDGIRINCMRTDGKSEAELRMTELIDAVAGMRTEACVAGNKDVKLPLILGGKIPPIMRRLAEEANVRVIDYYDSEELQVRNSVPTAEGAVAIAMNELPVTIMGCEAIVLGYGRVGRRLSATLAALGAKVTVAARSERDLAWADVEGARGLPLAKFREHLPVCDVIFNTVPFCILNRSLLEKVQPSTLIIDLAGSPGGVDVTAAKELGCRVIWAQSLPGKTSPASAGRILGDCIIKIIREEVLRV